MNKSDFKVCLSCKGDGYDIQPDGYGEPEQVQCEWCQATGIMTSEEVTAYEKLQKQNQEVDNRPVDPNNLPF